MCASILVKSRCSRFIAILMSNPRFHPSGIPISTFIVLPTHRRAPTVAAALALVDAVHGDGELAFLSVEFALNVVNGAGAYAIDEQGHPDGLLLPKLGRVSTCAVVEEIGHMLDHQALNGRPWASTYADSDLHEVMSLILSSKTVRRVFGYHDGKGVSLVMNGKTVLVYVSDELDDLTYHQDPREWWARAYVQFIAEASQDASMLTEIARYTPSPERELMYPTAWPEVEFQPIKQAIQRVFLGKGWMRR
jgi:hypothetical protein